MASLSRWASPPAGGDAGDVGDTAAGPDRDDEPLVVECERLQRPALQLCVQVSGDRLAFLQSDLCQRGQHVPAAGIHHRGEVAGDVDRRMVQYTEVLVDLDAAVVAGRHPRIDHDLGCLHPTRPDEHAALHQPAVLESEALVGRRGDRRLGADLDAEVGEDGGGLVDQLLRGAGQDGGARLDEENGGPVGRQAVGAGHLGQHLGQLAGQLYPGGATAADDHRRQAALSGGVGGGRSGRERGRDRRPHSLGVIDRIQRQRALGQAGDGEVIGPAAERQYQPSPADRPSLGEQTLAGHVDSVDLGPDEADLLGQHVVQRDAHRVGGARAGGNPR